MLASELAQTLDIDPSSMSRWLQLYAKETGWKRERFLDETAISTMRSVQQLLTTNQAKTAREAIQRVVGTYASPIPAMTAREILQRLDTIEENQRSLLEQISGLTEFLSKGRHQQGTMISSILDQLPDDPENR